MPEQLATLKRYDDPDVDFEDVSVSSEESVAPSGIWPVELPHGAFFPSNGYKCDNACSRLRRRL